MSTTLSGAPKTIVDAVDASILQQPSPKGIFCFEISTERGEPSVPVFVSSDIDFFRKFGSYIQGLDGVDEVIKALKRGAKAWISRVAHYTNVSDKTTLVGTKASVTTTVATTAETRATGTFVVTDTGSAGDTIELVVNNGNQIITLAQYEIQGTGSMETPDTNTEAATGLRAALSALTSTTGWTASGSGANIIATAPVGSGATANGWTLGVNIVSTTGAAVTVTQPSGGVTQILSTDAGTSVWKGKFIGPGYAGVKFTTTASRSGTSGKVDVKMEIPGYPELSVTYKDFNRTPSADDITALNLKFPFGDLESVTTRMPYGVSVLTGGVYDTTLFTDNDYIGNNTAKTGFYSFDSVLNASRIANVERATLAIDVALDAYVKNRKNMLSRLSFPKDLTEAEAIAYRNASGIDSWQSNYTYGDVIYYDPIDATKEKILVGIGDVCGLRAVADSRFGEWISESGGKRGKIDKNKGLVRNAQSDQGTFDNLYDAGVNAIIVHETFSTVMWGNKTLLKDTTKLLSKQNVAELMILILRTIKPMADSILFDPNDPLSWNLLYRTVRPFIKTLEDGRAIVKGEGKNWFWLGDQDADTINDVTFNTVSDINAGRYRARFVFIPITATEYIGIEVTSTDSGSLQFAVVENPL